MKIELYSQLFEPDRVYIPEQRLQKLWVTSLWKQKLETLDGDLIQVVSPGTWNRHEGPDFRDALLFIGDKIREGDIEIHYQNGDWYHHGHHRDPAYDRVVLHVIFSRIDHSRIVVNSRKKQIPVCLANYEAMDDTPFEAVCQPAWENLEDFFQILKSSGMKRLNLKVDYIRRRLARFGLDLLCWWGLFQSSGLKANRSAFNRLFLSFPWEDYFSGNMKGDDIIPLLKYLGGFHDGQLPDEKYADLKVPRDLRWVRMGVRPALYPEHRLAWLGAFMRKLHHKSIYAYCLEQIQIEGFSKRFWQRFFRSGCSDCREPGETLSVELAMNALVPVLLASMDNTDDCRREAILNGIESISIDEYRLSRRFYNRHGVDKKNPLRRKWVNQQGILYIYERFCSQELADLCPLCNSREDR
ncbi:MAG: hypothetical protein PWP06_354 [Candidatus Marinimicrobia bacterium]|nr:hypothetical protein [Candidatus Neomarinimicrobiota bacterium]